MKKGQLEMMGIVVVVILLVMGLLFVVTFIILKPASEIKEQVRAGVLASSAGNSMLYITSGCRGLSFEELLLDCGGFGNIFCDGKSSCDYVSQNFDFLLNRSLAEQDVSYYFVGKVGEDVVVGPLGSPCPGERENWYQPLSTSLGTVLELTLDVCR